MIFGAPVGTLSCFAVILHSQPAHHQAVRAQSAPLSGGAVQAAGGLRGNGCAAWGSHGLLARVLNGSLTRDMAATAGAILVGVVVYVILVLALRTLTGRTWK